MTRYRLKITWNADLLNMDISVIDGAQWAERRDSQLDAGCSAAGPGKSIRHQLPPSRQQVVLGRATKKPAASRPPVIPYIFIATPSGPVQHLPFRIFLQQSRHKTGRSATCPRLGGLLISRPRPTSNRPSAPSFCRPVQYTQR